MTFLSGRVNFLEETFQTSNDYILKIPNLVSSMGEFKAALKLKPSTFLESTGSMTPSSHSLNKTMNYDELDLLKAEKATQYFIIISLHRIPLIYKYRFSKRLG